MHFLRLFMLACIACVYAQTCGCQFNGVTFAINNVADRMPDAANRSIAVDVTVATALASNGINIIVIHDPSVFNTTAHGTSPPSSLFVRASAATSVVLTPTAFASFTAGSSAAITSVPLAGAASAGAGKIVVRLASTSGGVRKDLVNAGFASDFVRGGVTGETRTDALANRVPAVNFKFISIACSTQIRIAASKFVIIVRPACCLVGSKGVMYARTRNTCANTTTATANCVNIADGSSTAVADTLGREIIAESTGSTVSTTMVLPGGNPVLGIGGQVTGALMITTDVNRIPVVMVCSVSTAFTKVFTSDSTKIRFSSPKICSASAPLPFKVDFEGKELNSTYCNNCKSRFGIFYLDVTVPTQPSRIPNPTPGNSATTTKVKLVLQHFVVTSAAANPTITFAPCSSYSACFVRNLQQSGRLDADTLVAASYQPGISCSTGKLLDSIPTSTSGAGNVRIFEKPIEGSKLYSGSAKYFDHPAIAIFSLFPSSGSTSGFNVSNSLTITPASMMASFIVNRMQRRIVDALGVLKRHSGPLPVPHFRLFSHLALKVGAFAKHVAPKLIVGNGGQTVGIYLATTVDPDSNAYVRDVHVPSQELKSALEGVAALSVPSLGIPVITKLSTISTTSTRLSIAITNLQSVHQYMFVGSCSPAYCDMYMPIGAGTTVTTSLSIDCFFSGATNAHETDTIDFITANSISDNYIMRFFYLTIFTIFTPQVIYCSGPTTGCAISRSYTYLEIENAVMLLTNTAHFCLIYSGSGQEAARENNAADSSLTLSTASLAASDTFFVVIVMQNNSCAAGIIFAVAILASGSQLACFCCTMATSERIADIASATAAFLFTATEGGAPASGSSITLTLLTEWCTSSSALLGVVRAACFEIDLRDFGWSTLVLLYFRQRTIRTHYLYRQTLPVVYDHLDDAASLYGRCNTSNYFCIIKVLITVALFAWLTSKLISACDPRFKHELMQISRTSVSTSKYRLVTFCWFAVILMITCAAHFVVWCNSVELACFHLHFLVTIFVTKPCCCPRSVIQTLRAFDGFVAHFHLKIAFAILRLAINSFHLRIAAAPKVIFFFADISLHIIHRVWRSRLKQMRTSVQRWTSCAVFIGYILVLPMHVKGYGGVRAPKHCLQLMQHNDQIWWVRAVACDQGGRDAGLMYGLQYHSCAVLSSGAVSCWGWNDYGQVIAAACLRGVGCAWANIVLLSK